MHRVLHRIGFLASTVILGACAGFPPGGGGILQEEIDAVISRPPLDQVNWGIRVADPERGQILYSRHGHLKFVPASNMKILATATALSLLGSEYRYRTDLLAVGSTEGEGGVLDGDLVLLARGDPTLSDRFFPTAEAPLDSLVAGLWASGIREVTGSLVVDVSAWDSTSIPGTWEVEDLPATYAATGGAFSIAEGALTVEVSAGEEPGAPATARWWPFLADEFISVGYTTVHPDSSASGRQIQYLPESRRLRLAGKVRVGEVDTIRISQRDPVRLASSALLRKVEERGIRVLGGLRIAWDRGEPVGPGTCLLGRAEAAVEEEGAVITTPDAAEADDWRLDSGLEDCPDAFLLTRLLSPPLGEIVQGILEPSQNWMTEQLVRTLGQELGREGSWEEGFRVERTFLTGEVGIDSLDIVLRDGSGMSAKNLVTPRSVIRILDYMRDSPLGGVFRNALASPGEEDGTLRNRLETLESRVFAKTGTITHVNSLSGYVFTDSGKELLFSILTNGSGLPSGQVRAGIDEVLGILARH
jgi:D-alanyl-D-alanine carboxypeptidase/D-alanyl-D-alanine-endopeptidase (penicillin-binding protein 4)